uniref:TATA box-binding protein-like 1 n=1 Tax=Arion vulgaris TaxID=1028688 RepID=A0A0B6ZQ86_9EUPU
MSLVSNSSLTSSNLHSQQHGASLSACSSGDNNCLDHDDTHNKHTCNNSTDIDPYVSNNYHVSADRNNSADINHNGDSAADDDPNSPVIDIIISNVVCTFSTRCYLNLKKIAMEGAHVEYRRENGMLNMKLRRPNSTATIWSSGKITCTGATSEDDAKLAARRIARTLQRLGFNIRFSNYRVVNVLGTSSLPFGIKLNQFSEGHRQNASYEPELHPGVTYRIKEPKATLKIFSTGSITVTAPCVLNVQLAIEHIYPLVCQFKMEAHVEQKVTASVNKFVPNRTSYIGYPVLRFRGDNDVEDEMDDDDDDDLDDDSFDSDISQD